MTMSHLPPPPPNAVPYAPPPPPPGGHPYQYPPYAAQGPYRPPPPPVTYQNGHHNNQSPPRQHTGHDRGGKSKMIVTRYARPPAQHQSSHPPPPRHYGQPPPPPVAAPYPQTGWTQLSPHAPPTPTYPPPPNYAQPPPPGNQYPPPPPAQQQAAYPSYPPPPAAQTYPPPPPAQHAAVTGQSYPPPPHVPTSWTSPAPPYRPQLAYSPLPVAAHYQPPAAPVTPAQPATNIPPPQYTPAPEFVIKSFGDPTFYDGWDEGEFEYGAPLWIPPKGDTSHDQWSIGQYIWHPPAMVTIPVPQNVDDKVPLATVQQKYDPAHNFRCSRYFETEDSEGNEYVFTFQRFKYIDEWNQRKDDPLFKSFTNAELHEDVVPADEVFQQVLTRPKENDQVDPQAELQANVAGYLNGTKGGTGKNVEAENILATLGVTGSAKPVFATPFPAYNPPSDGSAESSARKPENKREGSTPAPQRSGFNPFKVSSHASRQPTPRSSTFLHQPPPSVTPAAHYPPPRSETQSYGGSPSTLSPSHHQLTPPQGARYPPPPPASHLHHLPPPQHLLPSAGYGHHNNYHRSHGSPPRDYKRSPTVSPWNEDAWKAGNGHHHGTPATPGTPVGSDFGDLSASGHGPGSAQHTPVDSHDHRKRKMDEPESQYRKRSKPRPLVDSAYQRRW